MQNNLFISKNGTQRIQKSNHYILLTNISIKRCIKTSFETDLIRGGGKSSNQTSTLQSKSNPYPSHIFILSDFWIYHTSYILLKNLNFLSEI